MRKAVAIPYVIALILGIIVVGIIGYWFVSSGGDAIKTGSQVECDTAKFNFCKFGIWDDKCGSKPETEDCSICGNNVIELGEDCDPPGKDYSDIFCIYSCKSNCEGEAKKCLDEGY